MGQLEKIVSVLRQEIHPSGQGRIGSVKINPSLLRMREWSLLRWVSCYIKRQFCRNTFVLTGQRFPPGPEGCFKSPQLYLRTKVLDINIDKFYFVLFLSFYYAVNL